MRKDGSCIDVAKDPFDVQVQPAGEAFSVPRDDVGLAEPVRRLQPLGFTLIALEATAEYEVVVAATLAAAAFLVAVINPRQIRDFARAGPGSWPSPPPCGHCS